MWLGVCIKLARQNHIYHSTKFDGTAAIPSVDGGGITYMCMYVGCVYAHAPSSFFPTPCVLFFSLV